MISLRLAVPIGRLALRIGRGCVILADQLFLVVTTGLSAALLAANREITV